MTSSSETAAFSRSMDIQCRDAWSREVAQSTRSGPTDADDLLMERVVAGDRRAFRDLVERNIDRVVALSRRIVGARDADDIAQDVFLKIWTTRTSWDRERAAFRTWLYRVVVNRCIDYLRRPSHLALDCVLEEADTAPRADEILHDSEQATKVRAALQSLTEQQRIAVSLYYHEGLNARECAEILGLRLNAAESLLKRARARLREVLSAENAE